MRTAGIYLTLAVLNASERGMADFCGWCWADRPHGWPEGGKAREDAFMACMKSIGMVIR